MNTQTACFFFSSLLAIKRSSVSGTKILSLVDAWLLPSLVLDVLAGFQDSELPAEVLEIDAVLIDSAVFRVQQKVGAELQFCPGTTRFTYLVGIVWIRQNRRVSRICNSKLRGFTLRRRLRTAVS